MNRQYLWCHGCKFRRNGCDERKENIVLTTAVVFEMCEDVYFREFSCDLINSRI